MAFQCSDCGTNLNPGFYVCPACGHDNTDKRGADTWSALVEKDKKEAKRLGYKTLRPFYEDRHNKQNENKPSGGIIGMFKSKPKEFNPDEILSMHGGFFLEGRPLDNDWMDESFN